MDHSPDTVAPSTQTDARALRTRAALREALLRLLEERPFEQISVREIAGAAGVGYATFFRHHPSKESLLDEIASDQIETLLRLTLPVLHQADSQASCVLLCRYVDEHRTLWSALLAGGAAGVMRDAFHRLARLIPAEPSATDAWLPAELRIIHGTDATLGVLTWWLQHGAAYDAEAIGSILNRMVIAPTLQPPPA